MSSKVIIFLSILIIIFAVILFFLFLGRSIFLVKHIEIKKDFKIDKNKLLKSLKIYPLRSIWEYNIEEMNNELSKHVYLKEYKVSKKYPNTLVIKMELRKPIANIVGEKEDIYYIDEQGMIYMKANNNYPLLIFDIKDSLNYGTEIKGKYKVIIDQLYFLKTNHSELYNSISQIEVFNNKLDRLDYILYFKTMKQMIYLKNKIDVDSINKALSCSLFIKDKYSSSEKLLFTGNSFIVM
jgi:hypothetical protein